ncbi:DUF6090 family protein [Robiginitalea sp. IMCC43444]|uniref:DUF6090 family protein n=1 Tax=Robiginitalea sp. IMCC43444 TaxID=3459121 RepID=UPI0040433AA2
MLHFFRQIRQRLLTENKVSRYMLYAIGEILLVVIGILIALQIDNWSQDKKERQLELDLLTEIRNNLTEDLAKVEANIDLQNEILRCQKAFIGWLGGTENYNDSVPYFSNSLSYFISRSLLRSRFLANQGTYETLKQVGVKIIQNDSLRIQLTHLYEVAYPRYYIELEEYKKTADECLLIFEDHLEEMSWFEPLKIFDIEKLRLDRKINFRIKTLHNLAYLLPNRHAVGAQKNIEITLKLIEDEFKE